MAKHAKTSDDFAPELDRDMTSSVDDLAEEVDAVVKRGFSTMECGRFVTHVAVA